MKTHIIGSGISGLSLGYFLKQNGHEVQIYEASPKSGGVIATELTPNGMVQHGPHLMRVSTQLQTFFHELGVETSPLLNCKKYIFDKTAKNPSHLSITEILTAVLLQFKKRKKTYTSLEDFADHHYGKQFTAKILQAMANGVYATSVANLNEEIAFKSLYFTENRAVYHTLKVLLQKFNTKTQKIIAPTLGFQALIDALSLKLQDNISYNTPIEDISTLDGIVFITIPAFIAQNLGGISPECKAKLGEISYSNLDVTTVFARNSYKKQGMGFLTNAESGVLGVLFNSDSFPNRTIQNLYSYSIFSKNISQYEVEKYCTDTLQIQKCYFKSYQKAIPIYNNSVKNFMEYNSTLQTNYKFFTNYTGNSAIGKIITEAKTIAESLNYTITRPHL